MKLGKVAKIIAMAITIPALLTGCAGKTMIAKRNLAVETKMSDTVFLEPVGPEEMTAFLQIKNTSDKQSLELYQPLKEKVEAKGYKVVTNPKEAHYIIQANVLQVGETDLRSSQQAISAGYGGALTGALLGAGATAAFHAPDRGVLAGGLVGAVAGMAVDAMVKDTMYSIVTDIQIQERTPEGVIVDQASQSNLKQGTSSQISTLSNQKTNYNKYQTRIISTANKVNLKFEEAVPALIASMSQSISGLL